MLRKLCVNCYEHTPVEVVLIPTKEMVQDEEIVYEARHYKCSQCGEIIPNNELGNDNFKLMYRKYREKKYMLQPEDIIYIRKQIYGISIRLLAQLIGCSPATLSRYENGALQSKQHDNQLKMLRDPRNMKTLFESNIDEIPEGKDKQELRERLGFLLDVLKSADILKGFDDKLNLIEIQPVDNWNEVSVEEVERFFIIKGQEIEENENLKVSPLKLQKLMYYAQGWTIAYTDHNLFNAQFEAWQHGPVIPDVYQKYKTFGYSRITNDFNVEIEDLNLTQDQFRILEWVWDKYSKYEAKFLEDLTHMEYPWRITRGDLPSDANCNWIIDNEYIKNFFTSMSNTLKLLQKV
jgi:putative zinc finger/helix-turn-helix YgiT family protein